MIRGWCPTVHNPMPTGDGLLARVKPFGGRLQALSLHTLAAAAAAYGNGTLELTGRGNIQVRGLRDPAAFAKAMVQAGLADADPAREARRNVIAIPPCNDALVAEMESLLANTAGLPAKFCLTVEGDVVRLGFSPADTTDVSPGNASHGGHLVYLRFGQTTAAELVELAGRVPEVRTTPWRAFLSPVAVPGLNREPSSIIACSGSPACASATTRTRDDAARLERLGFARLHISGCTKGCAHPSPATTLVGRDGLYDLVRNGRACDRPELTGLTVEQAAARL